MRGCIETLSLSALLVINLSFMVLLMLGLCTVLVVTGADGGFIYHDGRVGIWGALCFIYAVCSLIAVSMVVMMRKLRERGLRPLFITGHTGWTDNFDFAFAHREQLCSPFGKRVHDPSAPYDAYDEADDTEEKAKSGYLKGVGR